MIHIPEGNYRTILEAAERVGASRFTVQKWVEYGLLEVITIPNLRHLVREDTLSEFLKRDRPCGYPRASRAAKPPKQNRLATTSLFLFKFDLDLCFADDNILNQKVQALIDFRRIGCRQPAGQVRDASELVERPGELSACGSVVFLIGLFPPDIGDLCTGELSVEILELLSGCIRHRRCGCSSGVVRCESLQLGGDLAEQNHMGDVGVSGGTAVSAATPHDPVLYSRSIALAPERLTTDPAAQEAGELVIHPAAVVFATAF